MRSLLDGDEHLHKVVTYTTRPPRAGEVDGFDYRFVTPAAFQQLVANGGVFEYERVYQDYYYGSPREIFVAGRDGIIELDYKGRLKYQERHPRVVSIFLLPPNLQELKQRILSRSQVSNLEARLANAIEQLRHAYSYDYIVKNQDLDACVAEVHHIIHVERIRRQGQCDLKRFTHEVADAPT